LFAGYRPCQRCRPLEEGGEAPDWVAALLAVVDREPERRLRDSDLESLGVAPERARRYFQSHYGMTFHTYCRGRRLGRAFTAIRSGAEIADLAYGHGYESDSGFREAFAKAFGSPPAQSRGAADCVRIAWCSSPLGPLVVGATDAGLCLLEFSDRRMLETQFATLRRRFGAALVPGEHSHIERLETELARYFEGELRAFTVPLVYPGTPFQERVWRQLLEIPYGETRSYEQLALAVAAPGAQRAVGTANGCNRIAIVIPCHRVVNKDGRLGGYGGGLWRKQWLLDLERAQRTLPNL
jgi:AraC family transcriptional regulator of adaptative response/methylated-DNA-[protein]-cysteine methyltransferase